ncbi:MAG: type I DNA topoisomerase [Brevinematales bacterium]|nr:type I DNA topoisomerase [Brevinematales bacterium]
MATQNKKKSPRVSSFRRKKLVVVESPSKATTIKKYLGKDYEVLSSVGHVIDLPKSRMGVDLETFEPEYIVMRDKSKVIKELRQAAKNAEAIYLASDPDREGEAIAWHIKNDLMKHVLQKYHLSVPIQRVKFNEITKNEIEEKIQSPEEINEKLVQAQQGRRVIDRIFGYQLSPLLWKKVKSGLSAGRVQSVALRMICERETEIRRFVPEEYWEITVHLQKQKKKFEALLSRIDGKKVEILSEAEAKKIVERLEKATYSVKDMKTRISSRQSQPPFITSTLQQVANTVYGYSTAKTMQIAQQLYEGVDIGSIRTGLITYMRTDSTRISSVGLAQARAYIEKTFGKDYLPETARVFSNKQSVQDAHEAIRPTNVEYTPESIAQYLTPEQYKIYSLIWKRFVASQMVASQYEQVLVEIEADGLTLQASASKYIFDGYQRVYDLGKAEKEEKTRTLPELSIGEKVDLVSIEPEQKFTTPPPRYTEASLVKEMEEKGIGRPSTYAPTIRTLFERHYIKKEGKSLVPTLLGEKVNELLSNHFPQLVDVSFTAAMESELDEVEIGQKPWKEVVKDFYQPFSQILQTAYENIHSIKGTLDEPTPYTCELCGKPMVKKLGRYGYFLACTGWPECRNAKPLPLGKCPKCDTGVVVEKKSRGRRVFYACNRYPDCDFSTFLKPATRDTQQVVCPKCGSLLFTKTEKKKTSFLCLKEGCSYEEDVSV